MTLHARCRAAVTSTPLQTASGPSLRPRVASRPPRSTRSARRLPTVPSTPTDLVIPAAKMATFAGYDNPTQHGQLFAIKVAPNTGGQVGGYRAVAPVRAKPWAAAVVVVLITGLLATASAAAAAAADESLDTTFGTAGKVTIPVDDYTSARAVAIQPDGGLVIVGTAYDDVFVRRLTSNGSIDTAFGEGGRVLTNVGPNATVDSASSVALQEDGKIIVAGSSQGLASVLRFTADGVLDPTFNGTGIARGGGAHHHALALQADGKVVAAGFVYHQGYEKLSVARYTTSGAADPDFGSGGAVIGDFSERALSVAIQQNGAILVAGNRSTSGPDSVVARYNADGSLDSQFGDNGLVMGSLDEATAVAVQPDGRILVAGGRNNSEDTEFSVVRYEQDGSPDEGFGVAGRAETTGMVGGAQAVDVMPDGRIVVAGMANSLDANEFGTARFNADGALDDTFARCGQVRSRFGSIGAWPSDVAVQADGKVVVLGDAATPDLHGYVHALVRYQPTSATPCDRTAPTVAVTGGPATTTASNLAQFSFVATDPDRPDAELTYQCRLEGAPFATCTSPWSSSALADGSHTFQVRALDEMENASVAATRTWRVDTTKPAVATVAPATFTVGSSVGLRYSATDGGSGVATYDVRYRRAAFNGTFASYYYPASSSRDWQAIASTSVSLPASRGYTYCLSVRARDRAGNLSGWSAERCTAVALDDRAMAASTGWARGTGSGYYAGTITSAVRSGVTLKRTGVVARRIALIATTCAACGEVRVYWNGTLVKRLDLARTTVTKHKQVLGVTSFASARSGTLTIRTVDAQRVRIDGIAINRS